MPPSHASPSTSPDAPPPLRLLALETSALSGSVALSLGPRLLIDYELPPDQRTAQGLAPAIANVLPQVAWSPRDIQLIVVTLGPGSFTGLRVGVATAKALAYAVQAQVLGVDTLAVVASQLPPGERPIQVVLDAQRRQLFTATYRRNTVEVEVVEPIRIVDETAWLAESHTGVVLTGPLIDRLAPRLPADQELAPPDLRRPRAAAVAQLGWNQYVAGRRDDLWKLAPNYYRPSAAEEKAASQD